MAVDISLNDEAISPIQQLETTKELQNKDEVVIPTLNLEQMPADVSLDDKTIAMSPIQQLKDLKKQNQHLKKKLEEVKSKLVTNALQHKQCMHEFLDQLHKCETLENKKDSSTD